VPFVQSGGYQQGDIDKPNVPGFHSQPLYGAVGEQTQDEIYADMGKFIQTDYFWSGQMPPGQRRNQPDERHPK